MREGKQGKQKKAEMPEAFFFFKCVCFSENDYKTEARVICLAENQNPFLHLYCTVNTLILLCSAENPRKPFSSGNEIIKINELIW